jgi:hypothetical protein
VRGGHRARRNLRDPVRLAPFCPPLGRVAGRDAHSYGFRICLEIDNDRVYERYAHGSLYLLGGYVAWSLIAHHGVGFWAALAVAALTGGAAGLVMQQLVGCRNSGARLNRAVCSRIVFVQARLRGLFVRLGESWPAWSRPEVAAQVFVLGGLLRGQAH